MSDKPLSYPCLKALLLYLEPNKRVEAALRIPSIQTAHKSLPLRMEKVVLKTKTTAINNIEYRLGVYQQYFNQSDTPMSVKMDNEEGGYVEEIDIYGIKSCYDFTASTPGDLDLRRPETWPVGNGARDDITEEENLRQEIRNVGSEDELSDDEKRSVDSMKVQLQMYHFKRNAIPLPYKQYFQLTIKKPNSVHIERVESSGKQLRDAMKYINNILFGGKNQVIFINELTFPTQRQIYYLPENFKVRIKKLGILTSDLQSMMKTNVIVESSFPLAKLSMKLRIDSPAELLNTDIVRNADALEILHYESVDLLQSLHNLRNKVISIQLHCYHRYAHYIPLINNWMEIGRPVGTVLSLGVSKRADAEQILRRIGEQFEIVGRIRRSITIPMQHEQNFIKIVIEPAKPADQVVDSLHEGFETAWLVKIEVLEAQEQVPTGFFARGLAMLGALRCPLGGPR
ncbi:hypothetical protein CAEBREN_17375 [Caenorhabditis brenneri]|uniref:Uncharacterized protein n=1 Tax=Caenorhabditis brenneri TaxID=135651 RepID=G0NKS3_CAEBE|nr:hypothetical protein CAEBREN_17375 [Caenorhabditis brenneri]